MARPASAAEEPTRCFVNPARRANQRCANLAGSVERGSVKAPRGARGFERSLVSVRRFEPWLCLGVRHTRECSKQRLMRQRICLADRGLDASKRVKPGRGPRAAGARARSGRRRPAKEAPRETNELAPSVVPAENPGRDALFRRPTPAGPKSRLERPEVRLRLPPCAGRERRHGADRTDQLRSRSRQDDGLPFESEQWGAFAGV